MFIFYTRSCKPKTNYNCLHGSFKYTQILQTTCRFTNVAPTCELAEYNASNPKVNLVFQQCTKLSFTIISNLSEMDKCILVLKTATKKSFISVISVLVKDFPAGFTLNIFDQMCQCNPKLVDVC